MPGGISICFPALEVPLPRLTAVVYGVLDDMGMEGPVIRILRMPEHSIEEPIALHLPNNSAW